MVGKFYQDAFGYYKVMLMNTGAEEVETAADRQRAGNDCLRRYRRAMLPHTHYRWIYCRPILRKQQLDYWRRCDDGHRTIDFVCSRNSLSSMWTSTLEPLSGLVYAFTFIGGLFADKILGHLQSIRSVEQKQVWLGNGLFKPNISTLLGNIYSDDFSSSVITSTS